MGSSNSPCAACKLQRRKCTQGCIFAPYFPPDQPLKFSDVHRVFGASNVAKILNDISPSQREDAVNSLAYEAEARLKDPVYGCVGYIFLLQHRLKEIQEDLYNAKKELANYIGAAAFSPFLPHHTVAAIISPHHHHREGMLQSGNQEMGIGLGLMPPGGSPHPQMVLREQQQVVEMQHRRQMVEVQQMAAAAAARKQQSRIYEQQQQHEIVKLNRQQQNELLMLNSGGGSRGFNEMCSLGGGAAVAVAAAPPQPSALTVVRAQPFGDLFHVQQPHYQRSGSDHDGRSGISQS